MEVKAVLKEQPKHTGAWRVKQESFAAAVDGNPKETLHKLMALGKQLWIVMADSTTA